MRDAVSLLHEAETAGLSLAKLHDEVIHARGQTLYGQRLCANARLLQNPLSVQAKHLRLPRFLAIQTLQLTGRCRGIGVHMEGAAGKSSSDRTSGMA